MKRMLSFGFALSPWQTVKYVEGPSIGKFEGDRFDPRTWQPQMLTTAYMEARADDAFWAAQRVGTFTDEMIRAIIHTGEFRDPAAEKAIADIMIKRRDKILKAYLPAVNPIVSPRLDEGGRLTFANAAVEADVARRPDSYRAAWSEFDNATGDTRPIGEASSPTPAFSMLANLPQATGSYVAIEISADGTDHDAWRRPVRTYFRREATGWRLVGLERLPDEAPAAVRRAN